MYPIFKDNTFKHGVKRSEREAIVFRHHHFHHLNEVFSDSSQGHQSNPAVLETFRRFLVYYLSRLHKNLV